MSYYRPYIPEEWHHNIINYKYSGTDNSILYRYFLSPVCNKLVLYFPEHVAPNTITCFGLLLVVIMNVLVNSYSGWDGNQDIPGYINIIAGLLYYTYHILDNIDGKQARRTQNSSPLGMLCDHGCDSITTFMLSIAICSAVKLTGIWYSILFLCIGFPFFVCTWEQSITGQLYLPAINGVDEGSLIGSLVLIITGIVGQKFWLYEMFSINDVVFHFNEFILLCVSLFSLGTIAYSLYNICKENAFKALKSLPNIIPMILISVSMILVFSLKKEEDIIDRNPKLVIYLYGFIFAKMLLHLMISHLAHKEFEYFIVTLFGTCFTMIALSIWNYIVDIE